VVTKGNHATISKGLFFKGEITGSESLFIDGKVEGAINLPGSRVTVERNGQVGANIFAREIVVLGKVRGNLSASDRVDIHAEGALTGDVSAARVSIEDGAYFKGGIDIRKKGGTDTRKKEDIDTRKKEGIGIRKPEIKPAPLTTTLAMSEVPKPIPTIPKPALP
jgi:cytoskeletal protein CcmA (bactofilin family)